VIDILSSERDRGKAMSEKNGFLDERAMANLAQRTLADLRKRGFSSTELNRLEISLREGNVGEVYIFSGLLQAVVNEISPEASQKKLLHIYQGVEHCCYSLVELSRNLSDVEVWGHYKVSGYEGFDSYCLGVLEVSPAKIQQLKLLKDRLLPRPGNAGPAQLFSWLFEAIEVMANGKGERGIQ
jgi:hypothetical protein